MQAGQPRKPWRKMACYSHPALVPFIISPQIQVALGIWLFVTKAVPEVGGQGRQELWNSQELGSMFPLEGACTGHLCVHHTTYFSLALQGLVRERIFHTVEFCTIVIGKMRSQKTTSLRENMFIYLFNIYLHKYASRTYEVPNTS